MWCAWVLGRPVPTADSQPRARSGGRRSACSHSVATLLTLQDLPHRCAGRAAAALCFPGPADADRGPQVRGAISARCPATSCFYFGMRAIAQTSISAPRLLNAIGGPSVAASSPCAADATGPRRCATPTRACWAWLRSARCLWPRCRCAAAAAWRGMRVAVGECGCREVLQCRPASGHTVVVCLPCPI